MLALLNALFGRRCRNTNVVPSIPTEQSQWIVDLPPIGNIRLGPFRTKQEALDYRREYIIRKLTETNTAVELPC